MSTDEFKKEKPEYAHLEGDELWDAMTMYMLTQQQGDSIILTTKPFWKRYKLRWLFYRKGRTGFMFGKNDFTANTRCAKCKKGVSSRTGFAMFGEDGKSKILFYCPHCHEELQDEPNRSLLHILYKLYRRSDSVLDALHILRKHGESRYGIFGDESNYVHHFTYNIETGKQSVTMKKRKWFEYIFIKKK